MPKTFQNIFRINFYLSMNKNSRVGFNLQVPDYQAGWSNFYFVIGHLCFVCEMSVYDFCSFFYWILYLVLFFSFPIDSIPLLVVRLVYVCGLCGVLSWHFSLTYFYVKLILQNKKKLDLDTFLTTHGKCFCYFCVVF